MPWRIPLPAVQTSAVLIIKWEPEVKTDPRLKSSTGRLLSHHDALCLVNASGIIHIGVLWYVPSCMSWWPRDSPLQTTFLPTSHASQPGISVHVYISQRKSMNQKVTGSDPAQCTTNRPRASRRWRFFFLPCIVGKFPALRPVPDGPRSGSFVMCLSLLFLVIRPIITNPITATSVRPLIFPDVLWFFRGLAWSQIVSHRPENVADQAPSRNDVILPFVGIAVKQSHNRTFSFQNILYISR